VVGDAGRLTPAGDVDALAAALTMDARTRERLGREGRERALARFELAANVRRLERLWLDVAESPYDNR
jgi:glycosyltransferase involved in cell wall biosynthesis